MFEYEIALGQLEIIVENRLHSVQDSRIYHLITYTASRYPTMPSSMVMLPSPQLMI